LCAGYLQLKQYDTALKYCEILLARDDTSWRGYNNRALIYIRTEQWEKAREDLERGEALNPGAYTLKVARSIYMDAVHPVEPEVEIDDRDKQEQLDDDSN
jgi:tetratricopeptide (TPR) repeat protein